MYHIGKPFIWHGQNRLSWKGSSNPKLSQLTTYIRIVIITPTSFSHMVKFCSWHHTCLTKFKVLVKFNYLLDHFNNLKYLHGNIMGCQFAQIKYFQTITNTSWTPITIQRLAFKQRMQHIQRFVLLYQIG